MNDLSHWADWATYAPAVPEIYLAAAICVLLLADVFIGERVKGFTPTLTLLLLAGGAAVTLAFGQVPGQVDGAEVARLPGQKRLLPARVGAFNLPQRGRGVGAGLIHAVNINNARIAGFPRALGNGVKKFGGV